LEKESSPVNKKKSEKKAAEKRISKEKEEKKGTIRLENRSARSKQGRNFFRLGKKKSDFPKKGGGTVPVREMPQCTNSAKEEYPQQR